MTDVTFIDTTMRIENKQYLIYRLFRIKGNGLITAETLRLSLDGLKLKFTYDIMDFCIVKVWTAL